ncbi:MAG: hypothetical protein KC656_15925 [Myxococcales bacterium]|nr:hypothetical protein [Myxococcales bacterium]MCB9669477.1 hypothetical protein [Alphaproteobacteria bacterium]MCB9692139.1 hypothetical protein [Alphaproteobacteria bacterium]MCB9700179.1 hypothetical protein [Alphaproteobacteria bacterium]
MAKTWKEALEDLGARARDILAELGIIEPEPELVPVPVRTKRPARPGEHDRR